MLDKIHLEVVSEEEVLKIHLVVMVVNNNNNNQHKVHSQAKDSSSSSNKLLKDMRRHSKLKLNSQYVKANQIKVELHNNQCSSR